MGDLHIRAKACKMGLPKVRDQEVGGSNPLAPTTITHSEDPLFELFGSAALSLLSPRLSLPCASFNARRARSTASLALRSTESRGPGERTPHGLLRWLTNVGRTRITMDRLAEQVDASGLPFTWMYSDCWIVGRFRQLSVNTCRQGRIYRSRRSRIRDDAPGPGPVDVFAQLDYLLFADDPGPG
jgi:hypothetical protein